MFRVRTVHLQYHNQRVAVVTTFIASLRNIAYRVSHYTFIRRTTKSKGDATRAHFTIFPFTLYVSFYFVYKQPRTSKHLGLTRVVFSFRSYFQINARNSNAVIQA